MNIFISIYTNWTVYEWILLLSSLLLIFLLTNLGTYLLTKNWSFTIPISITYGISSIIYILLVFGGQFLNISISHLFVIPVLIIPLFIALNWTTLVSYYSKFKDSKNFSLVNMITEYKKDTIRNIVFLTIAMLSVFVFLRQELLIMSLVLYIATVISIYINVLLVQRFVHD